ncbi:MAG: SURF1 family protein [Gammaproteobacteria bacterium]
MWRIPVGQRRLAISWPGLLVLLICLPILLRLGFWQLQRAEYKSALLIEQKMADELPARQVSSAEQLSRLPPQTRVRLEGEYLPGFTTLLDNRYYQGRVGFNVISLFRPTGFDHPVLINRGWLPLGQYRYPLPKHQTPEGSVAVSGEVRSVPTDTMILKTEQFDRWPELIQRIDLEQLTRLTGFVLSERWVLASSDIDSTLKQDWPVTVVGPERHYGYAVQWFGLSIALVVVMILAGLQKTGDGEID